MLRIDEHCPSCGGEGPDLDHVEGCERIDTCGQFGPPWYVELHPQSPRLVSRMSAPQDLTYEEWDEQFVVPWREGLRQHMQNVEHTRLRRD